MKLLLAEVVLWVSVLCTGAEVTNELPPSPPPPNHFSRPAPPPSPLPYGRPPPPFVPLNHFSRPAPLPSAENPEFDPFSGPGHAAPPKFPGFFGGFPGFPHSGFHGHHGPGNRNTCECLKQLMKMFLQSLRMLFIGRKFYSGHHAFGGQGFGGPMGHGYGNPMYGGPPPPGPPPPPFFGPGGPMYGNFQPPPPPPGAAVYPGPAFPNSPFPAFPAFNPKEYENQSPAENAANMTQVDVEPESKEVAEI